MLGGTRAVLDQTALPNTPTALASDEGRLLPRQDFGKLLTLLFSPDEFIHVELVPGSLWFPPKVRDGAEDGIERGIQMFSEIFGEEAEDMTTALLKQRVLAAVTTVGRRIG